MLLTTLFLLSLATAPRDPVATARENFRKVESYSVTLHSGHGPAEEIIRYFYKKPGYIRMEFVQPHQGALLVYNPLSKKVRLRPFSFTMLFTMTLSPTNSLVKSARGHQVDASDIGSLLGQVQALQALGATTVQGEESYDGKKSLVVDVRGKPGAAVDGVVRYRLWLDPANELPRKVMAYGATGEVVEEVAMDDLVLNPPLGEAFFSF